MPRFERNTERRGRGGDDAAAWPAWSSCSCPLTDLPGHVLALIADALALVGLRRTLLADDRGHLADGLLGDAAHDHAGGLRDLEVDSLGSVQLDRVRIAERQDELAALQLSAVADALDLQALLEAVGDALDHVRDQAAREPVQRAVLAAVGRSRHADLAVVLLDPDLARHALLELALGPLHLHELGLDRDLHPIGDGDRLSADARHRYAMLLTCPVRPRGREGRAEQGRRSEALLPARRGPRTQLGEVIRVIRGCAGRGRSIATRPSLRARRPRPRGARRGRSSRPWRWRRSWFPCRPGPWAHRSRRRTGAGPASTGAECRG